MGRDDYAFITIGSMTADSRNGDDDHAPLLVRDKRDGAWTLWENMARKGGLLFDFPPLPDAPFLLISILTALAVLLSLGLPNLLCDGSS